MRSGLYQVGSFIGDSWKEWNGRFRDDVRSFFRGGEGSVARLADRLVGSPEIYGHKEREVEQSVNFVTCHDGFTLNDLVSYDQKHNEENGEDNRDGMDRHGRLPVLQKSCPSRLWASLSLRAGHQDAEERSHCQGRAKNADRRDMAIRRDAARFRGLLETEHVFRRAAEPHDPTGLGLSFSADDLPRAMEGASRRSPGVASLLLQLRQASHGVEVRTRDEDAGDPGRTDDATADVTGDLPVDDASFVFGESQVPQSTVLVVVDETGMPLAA